MQPNDAIYPSLRDKVVFVSGGATGIGASHVAHFAAQGAQVAFVDIQDAPAQALAEAIAAKGQKKPLFIHCDLRDIAAYQAAIALAAVTFGTINVLVNNAAHDERHDWKTVTVEYWEDRLAVNLRHQFFAIQAAAPFMQKNGGGSIINFGSISWHLAMGGMPAYTTAKAGIEGLTRSFAKDLGPDNIRVNCLIPGWILTERQKTLWLTPEAEASTLAAQCLKRMLVPDDVARMVLWLAADDSRMCTSQLFTVDGGWW
ncbi:MAG: SDR family NAD(P)-dependent oxidoreductase [Alphaproteobacteria bacterium]|nr:SDR family NAD(P)-dependent oxidoreductase [Alphaproteobacteria bacterium]